MQILKEVDQILLCLDAGMVAEARSAIVTMRRAIQKGQMPWYGEGEQLVSSLLQCRALLAGNPSWKKQTQVWEQLNGLKLQLQSKIYLNHESALYS